MGLMELDVLGTVVLEVLVRTNGQLEEVVAVMVGMDRTAEILEEDLEVGLKLTTLSYKHSF